MDIKCRIWTYFPHISNSSLKNELKISKIKHILFNSNVVFIVFGHFRHFSISQDIQNQKLFWEITKINHINQLKANLIMVYNLKLAKYKHIFHL